MEGCKGTVSGNNNNKNNIGFNIYRSYYTNITLLDWDDNPQQQKLHMQPKPKSGAYWKQVHLQEDGNKCIISYV